LRVCAPPATPCLGRSPRSSWLSSAFLSAPKLLRLPDRPGFGALALPVAAFVLAAAACTTPTEQVAPTAETAESPTPGASPAPAGAPAGAPTSPPLPAGLQGALVVNVVDGDTIDVRIDGNEYRVRYIGIDTPETVDPRRPVGCFGREASERNRELVGGQTVGLERDVSETDDFGRLLRYVWLGERMVNATLVEEGYALAATYPPDVRHAGLFAELQSEAREAGRGLWAECSTPEPSPAASGGGGGDCDFSGTEEAVIKGNISQNTGEKIYHVPGGDFYDDTVVNEAAGERWFCREAEAVAAGWRKSKR
jgi:micrococcal nuclease